MRRSTGALPGIDTAPMVSMPSCPSISIATSPAASTATSFGLPLAPDCSIAMPSTSSPEIETPGPPW